MNFNANNNILTILKNRELLKMRAGDILYAIVKTPKNIRQNFSLFTFIVYSKLRQRHTNLKIGELLDDFKFITYIYKVYNIDNDSFYELIRQIIEEVQIIITNSRFYSNTENLLMFNDLIIEIPNIFANKNPPAPDSSERKLYDKCIGEIKLMIDTFENKLKLNKQEKIQDYNFLLGTIRFYFDNTINNDNNKSIYEDDSLHNISTSLQNISTRSDFDYSKKNILDNNNNNKNNNNNNIKDNLKILDTSLSSINSSKTNKTNKKGKEKKLKKFLSDMATSYYYTKSQEDIIFNEKIYNKQDYKVQLIGSYTLGTKKSKESQIDLVFTINDSANRRPFSPEEFKKWLIKNKPINNMYLDDDPESNNNNDSKTLVYLTLKNTKNEKLKDVNLYLYKEKYIFCNDQLKRIFKDSESLLILHCFFYHPLLDIGLCNGSEVMFVIVAFLDVMHQLFNTDVKKYKEFKIVKDRKFDKEKIYYYEINEESLRKIKEIANVGKLIEQFNDFVIDCFDNQIIEQCERLKDKMYLFRVKGFYDKINKINKNKKGNSNCDNGFKSLKGEIDNWNYNNTEEYEQFYKRVIKKKLNI